MSTPTSIFLETQVVKRDGSRVSFDHTKIEQALEKAFQDTYNTSCLPDQLRATASHVLNHVLEELEKLSSKTALIHIEKIQDIVEHCLMAADLYEVAKDYILYREARKRARLLNPKLRITHKDGSLQPIDISQLRLRLLIAGQGFEKHCSTTAILDEAILHLYDGAKIEEAHYALILASRSKIESEPAYSYFTARLLLQKIYEETFGESLIHGETLKKLYRDSFKGYLQSGVELGRISKDLLSFDLDKIAEHLSPERDSLFQYLGLQILYDRYLIHDKQRRIEPPQFFWMRVAMGLALNEENKEAQAVRFYDLLSQFLFISSTPTLFNAGTNHPQLSSCYLSTIEDDLDHIYKVIGDNARLSKWAGGIGNDWSNVRATGALIKGTNGLTQGVVPFLKVANDTAVAVNQGGKRKGAVCAYLETWHLDIEDFLELRKNTGDDRRRTHDMNTANWIPDLFMERVHKNGSWTLFNPADTPDLHDLYGKAFKERYEFYEREASEGRMAQFKTMLAMDLWRKMLTMLFETGHPWIAFKDPCNIRSPQAHVGVVHSSNLCTEITLNTSAEETAVCNLGSINLAAHMKQEKGAWVLDKEKIASTISTAVRMLDNVIDINFYPTKEAKDSNVTHRPIGLGLMAFQDALYKQKIAYDSKEAVHFADLSMELISYYAILASTELAKERGKYSSFKGSKWDQGLLPIDTIDLLNDAREIPIAMDRSTTLDWNRVRSAVREHGMRNSNVMAIAPTATIAHIAGVSPSIEPAYSNLFSRSNLSGEFTSLNPYLVEELKTHGLWNGDLLEELKYYDGSVQEIAGIPQSIKDQFKTAFEIAPKWLVECASRRQKWIDQSQSLNLYVQSPTGKMLSDLYFFAWSTGLKTTYYLRTLGATQIEKSTIDLNKRGIQPRWMKSKSASSNIVIERKTCSITNPECESCQ